MPAATSRMRGLVPVLVLVLVQVQVLAQRQPTRALAWT